MKTRWVLMMMLAGVAPLRAETLTREPFGVVTVYRHEAAVEKARGPREVVLFLSGDGGWNLGVISMAQHLADEGATVAGIDIRHYLAQLEQTDSACVSPADDLQQLGQKLQADSQGQPVAPTLVGYSSGATLVYAALVQAHAGSFKGALSLGFCPDLDLKKPLCKGAGVGFTPRNDAKGVFKGVNFLPAKSLSGRWISLQGELDQVCAAAPTIKFVAEVPGAELVLLPKVGHGYSVEHNWVPQYLKAFHDIVAR
jgi:type IV secretory pathway VirJ component